MLPEQLASGRETVASQCKSYIAEKKQLQPQIYTQYMQMHLYKQCPRYQVAPPGNGGQNYLLK